MNLRSVLATELTRVYETHNTLTPQIVVDESRPKSAPLHDRFEWDDKTAGEAYRRQQAAEMIRSVRIEYAEKPERRSVRAWIARTEVGDGSGYAPVEEVVQDDLSMQIIRRNFERELADLQRKYGHLDEFAATLRKVAS